MKNAGNENELAVVLRRMTEGDLASVVRLERQIFPDPWPRSAFARQPGDESWGAVIAEYEGRLVGYACYLVAIGECHLINIAVDPEHRRKSVAKQLLFCIFQVAVDNACKLIRLEVRVSNETAIAFYRRYGFEKLCQRPEYYQQPQEDALVMVKPLEAPTKSE
ncbi:MAG TPA: ribosomal protein S18-alanine N-acetyltransferase [Acidobacteriota bacterium]|nr:ribosomal protein S18-alanine N-acetyltransferase [Acidobacteriota bacterium]